MQLYQLYEMNFAALKPMRALSDIMQIMISNPLNPLSATPVGRSLSAAFEVFERTTRRYGKPSFNIKTVLSNNKEYKIIEKTVLNLPFCKLLHFEKQSFPVVPCQPKVLIVAPMSGHYATLLRGTVEKFLQDHDVYITDWEDARTVSVNEGSFDLDSYIEYVMQMIKFIGANVHVIAVCQPSVPVIAAVSIMNAKSDCCSPASMTLMGGPIDTRISPTKVSELAQKKGLSWFEEKVIMNVPFPNAGFMRKVYPGFLQLSGFMSLNLERHINAHKEFYNHLVKGDGDSAEKHREFYDEYLAVMDLPAEFYLQTIDTVFIKHSLPKGEMMHNGMLVDCRKITQTALLTVEGENDDITGGGQTEAAQNLCTGLSKDMKQHYLQKDVGHYGVFNGSRFRNEIYPRIKDFIAKHAELSAKKPKKPAANCDLPSNITKKPKNTLKIMGEK